MTTDNADTRRAGTVDIGKLIARVAAETDAETDNRRQPTYAEIAEVAYEVFRLGLWELSHDDHAAARHWLASALRYGVEEARPLLELCLEVLHPTPSQPVPGGVSPGPLEPRHDAFDDNRPDAPSTHCVTCGIDADSETPLFYQLSSVHNVKITHGECDSDLGSRRSTGKHARESAWS